MTDQHPDITQPHGAPDQKARVLEWLRTEEGGLTQLQALQHLAVARLAAVIYRLREDDGHVITTELVEMPTRYGPAQVARYHLAPPRPAAAPVRVPMRDLKPHYTVDTAPGYLDQVNREAPRAAPDFDQLRREALG